MKCENGVTLEKSGYLLIFWDVVVRHDSEVESKDYELCV